MEQTEIIVINKEGRQNKTDWIAEEVPLTIDVNGKELVTLLCSPTDLKELTIGFLYTSGIISQYTDIKSIVVDSTRNKVTVELNKRDIPQDLLFRRVYTSGCGKGTVFYNSLDLIQRTKLNSNLTITYPKIVSLMKQFQFISPEFRQTGAVHTAGLAEVTCKESILLFNDDIGRHNAVDKLIGQAILKDIDLTDKCILTTGRISTEILFKVNRGKVPILISSSAPTWQTVNFARELNMTVIGFVRGQKMNVYSGEHRVESLI